MGDHWTWRYTGKKLANKAKLILTNSEFTRNYLPATKLKVIKEKIIKVPLTYLNQIQKVDDDAILKEFIKSLPPLFVFYPTRVRPSKRLNDFSKAVSAVAIFIIIFVFGLGNFLMSCSIVLNFGALS